nr:unnamed protein product [Callosobruchus chinensis]
MLKNADTIITDNIELAETFANHFHESFSGYVDEPFPILNETQEKNQYNLPITYRELIDALHRCKDTSPGRDGIRTTHIKNLNTDGLCHLLKIYNMIWNSGQIPDAWKTSILIPIHKPQKSRFVPDSYRPVALTSHLCKLLERIANNRLTFFLNKNNLITKHQIGFLKGHSTIDHIMGLQTDISDGFIKNHHTTAIFLDLCKAFDTVKRSSILNALKYWGINGNLLKFVASFLSNRKITVRINNTFSSSYPQLNGVPQGSSISPTLFIIAMNSITNHIPQNLKFRLFADDIVIYHTGTDYKQSERLLQNCLDTLPTWATNNGLAFSPDKSTNVHFCRKRICPRLGITHIDGKEIPCKNSHKFLGVIFDSRLSWNPHITYLKDKCAIDMRLIKMLSHTSWGSHRNSILNIYKATILSKIDYGSQCYITAPTSYIKKLDAIHNSGLRMALGAFHTSPVNSIYCEAECPSLCFRRETLLHKYANSLKFKPHLSQYKYFFSQTVTTREVKHKSPYYIYHNINHRLSLQSAPPYQTNINIDPPWSIAQANIDLSLSRIPKKQQTALQIKQTFLDIKHTKYPNHKFIYTDGSKTSNNTGAAYVGDNVEATYKIAQQAGILTAELIAITKALEYIRNNPHTNWVIATDSLNSIKTIQAYQPKHPLGIEIQNKTNQLTNQNKFITYLWIPSHSQIIGNEKADKMAKAAHNSLTTLNYSFWKEDMNAIIKAAFNNLSQLNWDLLDDSKLSEIKEVFFKRENLRDIPRKRLCIMTRLRIGHTKLTHEYLLKHEDQPYCTNCNTAISIKHIFTTCKKYENERKIYNITGNLKDTLQYKNIDNIINFLKKTNLFTKI